MGFDKFTRGIASIEQLDFESERLPLQDNEADLVVLSHVLEHLERLHFVLNESLRVSRHVFIALPTQLHVWALVRYALGNTNSRALGLPLSEPKDRHSWFFSMSEAERLIAHFDGRNNCNWKAIYICHDRVPSLIGKMNKNLLAREGCWIVSKKITN